MFYTGPASVVQGRTLSFWPCVYVHTALLTCGPTFRESEVPPFCVASWCVAAAKWQRGLFLVIRLFTAACHGQSCVLDPRVWQLYQILSEGGGVLTLEWKDNVSDEPSDRV
jgi:hypothetical protein